MNHITTDKQRVAQRAGAFLQKTVEYILIGGLLFSLGVICFGFVNFKARLEYPYTIFNLPVLFKRGGSTNDTKYDGYNIYLETTNRPYVFKSGGTWLIRIR